MKSAYPMKKVGQIYEDMDGIQLEVTHAWKDGASMMRILNGDRAGSESCINGQSVFKLIRDVK